MSDSAAGSRYERLTAEQMDEQRIQNVAYQYLCRLEEAKRWMEACLGEELPAPTALEEALRNGVILAKLGHCFIPTAVPLKKIFDPEQLRYKAVGLQFRHTDNINHWRNAMSSLGLPAIFYPETTDVYDKKNMPRAVYCIHALSLYLYRLGLAPPIHDLYGKVKFTDEEINNMKLELDKYGIQMPAFNKIGGILANELSVDEAAVHAAVVAINEAVDRGDVSITASALKNPAALLTDLQEALMSVYQEMLKQARMRKAEQAACKHGGSEDKDMYEEYLSQQEIQDHIRTINDADGGREALSSSAITEGDRISDSRIPHEDEYIEARDVARYGGAGVPPWSQAWGWDSSESAWWPGCSSRDPAGPSPNERREAIPQWAHHLQGEP
ncbi:IQ motif-containing GTPase-activating protein 3 [Characodon lateralis]|uniref:IQ motif-containing GTPase-activating protein 3 n=1 Tax=Characodon lateralis TaxID=208331 RepID=A0ABU7DVE9_9TELE|nr:IQ motif-containing GTPase-activating protein 3 [Characodon lateralis]